MKVTYCDFCGAKLKDTDFIGDVHVDLSPRFGGSVAKNIFDGCSSCCDEVHKILVSLSEKRDLNKK